MVSGEHNQGSSSSSDYDSDESMFIPVRLPRTNSAPSTPSSSLSSSARANLQRPVHLGPQAPAEGNSIQCQASNGSMFQPGEILVNGVGMVPERVVMAFKDSGDEMRMKYVVKFRNSDDLSIVSSEEAKLKCPQLVLDYYTGTMVFQPPAAMDSNGYQSDSSLSTSSSDSTIRLGSISPSSATTVSIDR